MTDSTAQTPTDPSLENAIERKVDQALKTRFAEYRKLTRAFLAGFGLLAAVLLGAGLITQQNLIRIIHAFVFEFEENLDRALAENVAVSYSNSFWLSTQGDGSRQHQVAFYADSAQEIRAFVEISHQGGDEPLEVIIQVPGASDPVWRKAEDRKQSEPALVLTKWIKEALDQDAEERHFHLLVFNLGETGEESNDLVFVRTLITVSGREQGAS